jgi:hypothetical protein
MTTTTTTKKRELMITMAAVVQRVLRLRHMFLSQAVMFLIEIQKSVIQIQEFLDWKVKIIVLEQLFLV